MPNTGDRRKALAILEKVIDALRRGEEFGKVAKKYSDGALGGCRRTAVVDQARQRGRRQDGRHAAHAGGRRSQPCHPLGGFVPLDPHQSTKDGGRAASLAEVQDAIRQKIEEKLQKEAIREVLTDVYSHAVIESAFMTPEELGPPADVAGIRLPAKSGNDSPKKRRDRS